MFTRTFLRIVVCCCLLATTCVLDKNAGMPDAAWFEDIFRREFSGIATYGNKSIGVVRYGKTISPSGDTCILYSVQNASYSRMYGVTVIRGNVIKLDDVNGLLNAAKIEYVTPQVAQWITTCINYQMGPAHVIVQSEQEVKLNCEVLRGMSFKSFENGHSVRFFYRILAFEKLGYSDSREWFIARIWRARTEWKFFRESIALPDETHEKLTRSIYHRDTPACVIAQCPYEYAPDLIGWMKVSDWSQEKRK